MVKPTIIEEVQPIKHNKELAYLLRGVNTSISFVKLKNGDCHELHSHDIPSLVIVTRGNATLLGKPFSLVKENDVIYIETGSYHGFHCNQGEDMECISVQLENEGLSKDKYSELKAVCSQSWEIMSLLLDRIAQLTLAEINSKMSA